ncbi:uncharacterized protein LOC127122415 [Lathyrus oleraceus]|uniref:uncharacterized protein LOC127122415 n=1 Tax=Pisum sativum TaxID=3888 RepID=UPI0021D32BE6|nr:uncharacterized protein LOC127122415 [Pisum sativum]
MGQIAQQLASNSQAPGTLPSGTVTNPREHNTSNAVTTRSGKSTEVNDIEKDGLIEVDLEIKETKVQDEEAIPPPVQDKEKVPKPIIKLPYPPRQKKKSQHEKNFEKFLEMFKKLEINIPFSEALEQMPIYAKFMKDIIFKKRSTDTEPIILIETCSAVLQGASVSLMPLSIYKKLGIGYMQDTRMTLQFADRSVRRPYGIVEDVLVKINKFVFPVDFIILEMPKDEEIPLILGRPFLETGRCIIDIEEGTMTLKVYDEELKIDVRNTMQYKDDVGSSNTIEIIDQVIAQENDQHRPRSPLNRVLSLSIFESNQDEEEYEVLALMEKQPEWIRSRPHQWEDLRPPPSDVTEEPKKGVNQKQLPTNLKYVFLDTEEKCLAIINASLQSVQEAELIQVLKKYKGAIGWTIEDLKGISPTKDASK